MHPVVNIGDVGRLGTTENLLADRRVAGKFWKMLLLLAVKDRASEIRYDPSRGESALQYVVDGQVYDLAPPPESLAPRIFEELRDMARGRGPRAWLIRRLRALLRRLEGTGPTGDYFAVRVGRQFHGLSAQIRPCPPVEQSVVLRFLRVPDAPASEGAQTSLKAAVDTWDSSDTGNESGEPGSRP